MDTARNLKLNLGVELADSHGVLGMIEGWQNDVYLVLFDDVEIGGLSNAYGLPEFLPNYRLLGLRSWDDFIVADSSSATFTVPTVPISEQHIRGYSLPQPLNLQHDGRLLGRIKWYVKPIAFGGDPSGENITWVDTKQHAALVRWFNDLYRKLSAGVDRAM